jgi:hypothetical protein
MEFKLHERISDRHLTREKIYIGDNWAESIVRCKLDECHVIIDVPHGGPGIYNSWLTKCTIEIRRQIKDSQGFMYANYVHCKFRGKFLGMDFGRSPWPDKTTASMIAHGELLDCDFTEAALDLCRFFNVDITRQKFAPWPQFVIPYQQELAASNLDYPWPGEFSRYLSLAKKQNPALTASTGMVTEFSKRYKISSEQLEKVLDIIGDVIR